MSRPPAISIIIPTYNRGDILADTIRMAASQDYPNYEVIVVDQSEAVPDAVRAAIEEAGVVVHYVRLENPNLPAARNAGVRACMGEIIVFIDDDVVIGPEYLDAHVKNYEDSAVGGVMGLTLSPGHDERKATERTYSIFGAKTNNPNGTVRISSMAGGNSSFRRKAFIDAGMSDERFAGTGWGEDSDLSVRVKHAGYTLLFDPRIRLLHLALPTGGCENRDAHHAEKVKEEHCRLRFFFWIKNFSKLSKREALFGMWGLYRDYSLNRFLLRSPKLLLRRHYLFGVSVLRALRLCLTRTPTT